MSTTPALRGTTTAAILCTILALRRITTQATLFTTPAPRETTTQATRHTKQPRARLLTTLATPIMSITPAL
ncbi:hypothetical protein BX600DRAFT_471966 [Xylariales sp. PMI_506]|nr:hypothetical protein BX600DRAFT_471966 [Xylariales sp. PMI_506]